VASYAASLLRSRSRKSRTVGSPRLQHPSHPRDDAIATYSGHHSPRVASAHSEISGLALQKSRFQHRPDCPERVEPCRLISVPGMAGSTPCCLYPAEPPVTRICPILPFKVAGVLGSPGWGLDRVRDESGAATPASQIGRVSPETRSFPPGARRRRSLPAAHRCGSACRRAGC
jgi:hypothetical protein